MSGGRYPPSADWSESSPRTGGRLLLLLLLLLVLAALCAGCASQSRESEPTSVDSQHSYHGKEFRYGEPLLRSVVDKADRGDNVDPGRLAAALTALATFSIADGFELEAEELLRRALDVAAKHPDSVPARANGRAQALLARILERSGRLDEALELLDAELQVHENRNQDAAHRSIGLETQRSVAILEKAGVLEAQLRQAIESYRTAYGKDSIFVGRGLYRLALTLDTKGKSEDAEAAFREALAIYEKTLGANHPLTAALLTHIATLLRQRGDFDLARPFLLRALEIYRHNLGQDDPIRLQAMEKMGRAYQPDSIDGQQLRLTSEEKRLSKDNQTLVPIHQHLARMLQSEGEPEKAVDQLNRVLEILQGAAPPDPVAIAGVRRQLAGCFADMGRQEEAVAQARQALALIEADRQEASQLVASYHYTLGLYLHQSGKLAEAERIYRKTLEMYLVLLGPDHEFHATLLERLADIATKRGKLQEAASLAVQIRQIREPEKQPADSHRCLLGQRQ